MPGTTTDTSTAEDPSYTYTAGRHLHRHADGHRRRRRRRRPSTVRSRSTRRPQCATYRDDFNGTDLDAELDGRPARSDADRRRRRAEHRQPRPATSTRRPTTPRTSSCARPRRAPGRSPRSSTSRASCSTSRPACSSTATTTTTPSSTASATNATGAADDGEVRVHQRGRGHAAQRQRGRLGQPARRRFPNDFYMRVKSDGTNITGEYSTDGTTWTQVGQSAALPANAKIGVFALSNAAATIVDGQVRLRDGRRRPTPAASQPGRRLQRHVAGQDQAGTRSSARTRPSTPSTTAR